VLREEGQPAVLVDNLVRQASIQTTLSPVPTMFERAQPAEPAAARCAVSGLEVTLLALGGLLARARRGRRPARQTDSSHGAAPRAARQPDVRDGTQEK
jgi:hypothetical protein